MSSRRPRGSRSRSRDPARPGRVGAHGLLLREEEEPPLWDCPNCHGRWFHITRRGRLVCECGHQSWAPQCLPCHALCCCLVVGLLSLGVCCLVSFCWLVGLLACVLICLILRRLHVTWCCTRILEEPDMPPECYAWVLAMAFRFLREHPLEPPPPPTW